MNRRVLFKNTAGAVLSSSLPGADIVLSPVGTVVPVDSSAVLLKMARLLMENGFIFHNSGKVIWYPEGSNKVLSLNEHDDILEFLGSSRGEYLEYRDAGRVARDLYDDVEKSLKSIVGSGNFMFLSSGFIDCINQKHNDKVPKEIHAKYKECIRLWSSMDSYRDRLMISPELCGRLFALRFLDMRSGNFRPALSYKDPLVQFHPMHNTFFMFSSVLRYFKAYNTEACGVLADFKHFKTLFSTFVNELGGADRFLFYVREDYSGIMNSSRSTDLLPRGLSSLVHLENLASVSYVEEIVPGFNDAVLLIKKDYSTCLRCFGGDVVSFSDSGDLDWYFVDDSDPFLLSKERFFE